MSGPEWVFERVIDVEPSYDCVIVNDPCVHGASKPTTHGRASAHMRMILRGKVAEVILVLNTNWVVPETPNTIRRIDGPRGLHIWTHSATPFAGADRGEHSCHRDWERCYVGWSYTIADIPAELLVREGTDAVWAWLENYWCEQYGEVL